MTRAGPVPDFDTVILAGGNAARMGGADKPGLAVGGRPLLVSVAAAAAAAGTGRMIIVGPPRPGGVQAALMALASERPDRLVCACEDPPGGGPVAALRCGLTEVRAPWLALLAADLPFLTAAQLTQALSAAAAVLPAASGAVLADDDGRPQWLISCWRTTTLRAALAGYGGQSLHGLLAPLGPVQVRAEIPIAALPGAAMPPWLDCDTPDDLAAARRTWLANAQAQAEADATDPGG